LKKKQFQKKELDEIKKAIQKRKDQLIEGIQHISDNTLKISQKDAAGDISGYSYHMADQATDTFDREFSLGLASNEREMVHELDEALNRMEEGTYGVCESCKSSIAKARLKAVPYARLCVKCQQLKEKK
jgi:DnaK suppressor protein